MYEAVLLIEAIPRLKSFWSSSSVSTVLAAALPFKIFAIIYILFMPRWTAEGKFSLRVASWVLVSGGKFNVEFMGNVNNDRVAGAEIFPPLANKQNWIWLVEFATSLIFAPIPFT